MPTSIVGRDLPWAHPRKPSSADAVIVHAVSLFEASLCRGCGYPSWVCGDDEIEERVTVTPRRCYVSASIEKWHEDNKSADPDTQLSTHIRAEGEAAPAPMRYDADEALRAYEEQQRKYGLA